MGVKYGLVYGGIDAVGGRIAGCGLPGFGSVTMFEPPTGDPGLCVAFLLPILGTPLLFETELYVQHPSLRPIGHVIDATFGSAARLLKPYLDPAFHAMGLNADRLARRMQTQGGRDTER
ncbi:MAG: hypothetical protein H6729_06450 [Deltaproteobacteria bacterium]|nr:hypothetical protein [Deltaproteobacteria bacterium]